MARRLWMGAIVCALWPAAAHADEPLPFLPADKLPESVKFLPTGPESKGAILRIDGPTAKPVTIIIVDAPKVPSHTYMVRGNVKHEGVEKGQFAGVPMPAFLEMWSHFPGGGQFFSRTLGNAGPMAKIEGTSASREIALPFVSKPGMLPNKLEINVMVPGKGTIWLSQLTLTELHDASASEWWSEPSAGLVGGIGGGTLGLIGAVIGLLAGVGVARRAVISLCVAVIALGAAALVAGSVAWTLGQPWYVHYPFFLCGLIAVVVCGFNLRAIRRRYDTLELRRMTAMDA